MLRTVFITETMPFEYDRVHFKPRISQLQFSKGEREGTTL